jgi:hypothetical protein
LLLFKLNPKLINIKLYPRLTDRLTASRLINMQFRPQQKYTELLGFIMAEVTFHCLRNPFEPPTSRNHSNERRLGPVLTCSLHPHIINPSYSIPDRPHRISTKPVEAMDSKFHLRVPGESSNYDVVPFPVLDRNEPAEDPSSRNLQL